MKILILANNDLGLYRFRKELIITLLQDNEVYISLPYGEMVEPLVEQGCVFIDTPIDRRGLNPLTDFRLFLAYRKLVKDIKPDLVITYTIKPNIYGGLAAGWKGISYVVNVTGLGTAFEHDGLLQRVVTIMYRAALKKARVIFTENISIRDVLVQKKIASVKQLHVLSGAGVNLEDFALKKYPENEVFTFLFIGRVMKEKGIGELLEAVRSIREEGFNCVLHIVGFSEEDFQQELEKASREGWLIDFGLLKDVRPFIEAADCFVLPSWHEGMANTNLESASSGRPVITSDIPGCREAVLDGETGFLCESRNVSSLKEAMRRMMELPRGERARMGIAGRKYMKERFDKRDVVQDTIKHML